jgi:hypothetical protein
MGVATGEPTRSEDLGAASALRGGRHASGVSAFWPPGGPWLKGADEREALPSVHQASFADAAALDHLRKWPLVLSVEGTLVFHGIRYKVAGLATARLRLKLWPRRPQ